MMWENTYFEMSAKYIWLGNTEKELILLFLHMSAYSELVNIKLLVLYNYYAHLVAPHMKQVESSVRQIVG